MDELKRILQQITALSEVPEASVLKKLIDFLRVTEKEAKASPKLANERIKQLIELLKQHPEYGAGLAAFVLKLINQYEQIALFTDTGILSDQGFFNSLSRLSWHRLLPLLPQDDSIVELIDYLFDAKHDERWLSSIDDEIWDTLVDLIKTDDAHVDLVATAKNNLLNGMVILSYRISGIGLHPELMQAYPQMLSYSAAFVAQNQEAVLFVNQYRQLHQLDALKDVIPEEDVSPAPLMVMLEQCEDIVVTIRKRIYKTGVSIRITNMMLRLEQSLQRMRILTELLADNNKNRDKAVIELTQAIIMSAKRRYSIGYLIDNNTKLLSRKVTENASRVGEHYISTDKSGYKKMFKKASIGGFVIAFMATIKILAYSLVLAPIGRAFVNSMIYGLGFVFIHIIHGTVATKQPAMTAAAIASTISDTSGKKSHQLTKLSELIVDILRTQFVAIMGNVLIAMPMALIISLAWVQFYGTPMIGTEKAEHLLHDLNPFTSLALPHAAIAGVYLFMSGLIAGYYDNLAVYNHIGDRLIRHKLLKAILPSKWLEKFARFVEANLGAIMGNFLFGVFLGSTATIGYILGLPIDIRHIAFASANFVHGLFNLPTAHITPSLVMVSLLGVALIGMVNLMVSFSLALIVALRAKEVRFFEWGRLLRLLFKHLIDSPKDFFWPRPEPMQYAKIDRYGQMIFDDGATKKDGSPLPKSYVIRRLSDVKVMPENPQCLPKDKNAQTSNGTQPNNKQNKNAPKKVVVLDDGLVDDPIDGHLSGDLGSDLNGHLTNKDPQPDSFDKNKPATANNQSDPNILKQTKSGKKDKTINAKTPLPKPEKPPKLPD